MDDSLNSLTTIHGVSFTPREIDIISCLLSGKSSKTIASILSISPRTVEGSIREIMLKLECNSRESIRKFIESSSQFQTLQNRYVRLLRQGDMEKQLPKVAELIKGRSLICLLVTVGINKKGAFYRQIHKHLTLAGLISITQTKEALIGFESLNSDKQLQVPIHILYLLSKNSLSDLDLKKHKEDIALNLGNSFCPLHEIPTTFLLADAKTNTSISEEIKQLGYVSFEDPNSYVKSFQAVLKRVLPDIKLENLLVSSIRDLNNSLHNTNAFSEGYHTHFNSFEEAIDSNEREHQIPNIQEGLEVPSFSKDPLVKNFFIRAVVYFSHNIREKLLTLMKYGGGLFICFCVVVSVVLKIEDSLSDRRITELPNFGDLQLINRVGYQKKIEEAFSSLQHKGKGLPFASCLVIGPNGIGKSKLATSYGTLHQQEYDIVYYMDLEQPLDKQFLEFAKKWNRTKPYLRLKSRFIGALKTILNNPLGALKLLLFLEPLPLSNNDCLKDVQLEGSLGEITEALKTRLKNTPLKWLIILDNFSSSPSLEDFLSASSNAEFRGHHVLCASYKEESRSQNVPVIELYDPFTSEEGLDYLSLALKQEIIKNRFSKENLKKLAEQLGYYPLALTQAAATLKLNPSVTVDLFLEQFINSHKAFCTNWDRYLKMEPLLPHHLNYNKTIGKTLEIAWNTIKNNQKTRNILEFLCFFEGGKEIPIEVIKRMFEDRGWDLALLDKEVINPLRNLGFLEIKYSNENVSYIVRPIIRKFIYDCFLNDNQKQALFQEALSILYSKKENIIYFEKNPLINSKREIIYNFFDDRGALFVYWNRSLKTLTFLNTLVPHIEYLLGYAKSKGPPYDERLFGLAWLAASFLDDPIINDSARSEGILQQALKMAHEQEEHSPDIYEHTIFELFDHYVKYPGLIDKADVLIKSGSYAYCPSRLQLVTLNYKKALMKKDKTLLLKARENLKLFKKDLEENSSGWRNGARSFSGSLAIKIGILSVNLGDVLADKTQYKYAEESFREAYEAKKAGFREQKGEIKNEQDDFELGDCHYFIGNALMKQKKFEEAAKEFQAALENYNKIPFSCVFLKKQNKIDEIESLINCCKQHKDCSQPLGV